MARLVSIIFCALIMFGCDNPFAVKIKDLTENPRNFENRVITISGKVTDVFSVFTFKTFTVTDRTGSILVITDRIVPKKDSNVRVKGNILEAFALGDQTLTVFKEIN